MTPLTWAIILLLLALTFIFLEAFIPSAGLLSFFSLLALITSVVVAYRDGTWTGNFFLLATAAIIPAAVVMLIRWWPHTPIGRLILNQPPPAEEVVPESMLADSLIGLVGIAGNRMLPSGKVKIDGKSLDAITEGMAVEKGEHVEIVDVRGNYIVVRPASPEVVMKAMANKAGPTPDPAKTTDFGEAFADPFEDA